MGSIFLSPGLGLSETLCLCTAATVDKTEEVGCESGGLLLEMRKKSKKKKKSLHYRVDLQVLLRFPASLLQKRTQVDQA